jgi:hypothetical protein
MIGAYTAGGMISDFEKRDFSPQMTPIFADKNRIRAHPRNPRL